MSVIHSCSRLSILQRRPIGVALISITLVSCELYQPPSDDVLDAAADIPLPPSLDIPSTTYIKASNSVGNLKFGRKVAISGDTLLVGARERAYVYVRDGSSWREQATLQDLGLEDPDNFGECLAISGEVIAIGLQRAEAEIGVVQLYQRSGDNWTLQSTVRASNADQSDHFGCPVVLDGNTLVVGARDEDSNGNSPENNSTNNSGAVYVFERSGDLWEEQAYLKAITSSVSDYFGMRIAIDGDLLAVSALLEDGGDSGIGGDPYNDGYPQSGAVYTYTRTNSNWNFDSYIKSPTEWNRISARFGVALALKDGVLAIGAHRDEWGERITHILRRTNEAWEFESSILENQSYSREAVANKQIHLSGEYLTTIMDGGWNVAGDVVAIYKKESTSYALWATLDRVNEAIQAHALFGTTIVTGVPQDASNAVGINGNTRDSSTAESGAVNVYELE